MPPSGTSGAKPRIAVMGAGLIGQRHIANVAREAELCAIVDPAPSAAETATQRDVPLYADLDALLDAQTPDGVVVATPNQLHVAHGLGCIEAGIPLMIEKPIAADTVSARTLVEAAEAKSVPLLVGHHRRHDPLVRKARDLIDEGALGDLVTAQSQCWFFKPQGYFDAEWRRQPGAGPVYLNLIHDVDVLRFLCGDVVSVHARESNAVRGNPVEETAVAILQFENGVLATMTASDTIPAPWSWELTSGENPAYPRTGEACYRIGGTLGALSLPDLGLWHYGGERNWWEPVERRSIPHGLGDPFALEIRHFCDVVTGRASPLVPGREGLKTLAVIEAVKAAAASGTAVTL